MTNSQVTYAQNREDLIIYSFLKSVKKGFYVDIGASHPSHLSITKFFYDRGWRGINIEPDPKMFSLLERERPRDINVRIGLSDKPGKLNMRQYLGWSQGLSTFSDTMKKQNDPIHEYIDVETEVSTLKKVLLDSININQVIDFMKVDVEGYEYSVLRGNDWKKFRPKLICIEANHIEADWDSLLTEARYSEVFFDGLNKYYLAEEAKELLKDFSFADDVLATQTVPIRWKKEIEDVHAKVVEAEYRAEALQADINVYKTENLRLQREIIEQKRIVSLIKQFIKSSDSVLRHRIEKLNRPRRKSRAIPAIEPGDLETKDKNALLTTIRRNDLENYYSTYYQKDPILYRITIKGYDKSSKIVFKGGKNALGIIRKVKHVKKNS